MQFYLAARGSPPMPLTSFGPFPWAPKFTQNRTCARSVRKGARESAPEREKTDPWGPKGAKRCQNGAKMEAKIEASPKKCRKWFGLIIYHIYSLPAPSENLTF